MAAGFCSLYHEIHYIKVLSVFGKEPLKSEKVHFVSVSLVMLTFSLIFYIIHFISRLFNHQEMVSQAKAKYQRLPEVIYHRSEAKRKTSYRTNRMKATMYKKKLQKKVLEGRVTLTHHNQIL